VKNKLAAGLVILAILGVLGYLAFGSVSENLVYYWTPTELAAAGDKARAATVRLGGMVETGSIASTGTTTTFRVTDGEAQVTVRTEQIPPQMFREGIGVVVEGSMGPEGVFVSKRLMVKHDENYRAPTDPAAKPSASTMVEAP
jgi:cytochrome c-type biogenesis protein CcmE